MWEKPGGVVHISEDAGALPECDVRALMTPDHTTFQVCRSG